MLILFMNLEDVSFFFFSTVQGVASNKGVARAQTSGDAVLKKVCWHLLHWHLHIALHNALLCIMLCTPTQTYRSSYM